MRSRNTIFEPVAASLSDLTGEMYTAAVSSALGQLLGAAPEKLSRLASSRVEFFPQKFYRRLLTQLPRVGQQVSSPFRSGAVGATTAAFSARSQTELAPLAAAGWYRVGEDGRLNLTAKSEHYHTPLGHAFPGYRILENARRLGIPNATHNNWRGHITRRLEEELVRIARPESSEAGAPLSRVLNLQTGTLAMEAALKILLARFHRPQKDSPAPKYEGRIPVVLVMGDNHGDHEGNYHGTTVVEQLLRGMWAGLRTQLEEADILWIRPIPPNDWPAFEAAVAECNHGPSKVAGFIHEIVMMNYGALTLSPDFLRRAYTLCAQQDVPTVCDEIQSCLWSPKLLLFQEYGLAPSMVALGKGFGGGEYAASRMLLTEELDCLPQFGALVTNGQEEIASLSYLVGIRWAEQNAAITAAVGAYYQERLQELVDRFRGIVTRVEGHLHLAGMYFDSVEVACAFSNYLNTRGIDISVQTYKTGCPPSALTKLPLIAGFEVVDFLVNAMNDALRGISASTHPAK